MHFVFVVFAFAIDIIVSCRSFYVTVLSVLIRNGIVCSFSVHVLFSFVLCYSVVFCVCVCFFSFICACIPERPFGLFASFFKQEAVFFGLHLSSHSHAHLS